VLLFLFCDGLSRVILLTFPPLLGSVQDMRLCLIFAGVDGCAPGITHHSPIYDQRTGPISGDSGPDPPRRSAVLSASESYLLGRALLSSSITPGWRYPLYGGRICLYGSLCFNRISRSRCSCILCNAFRNSSGSA